jgi:hypothetical protein
LEKNTLWTVNDVTERPLGKTMMYLYSFCGGISSENIPQISIYKFRRVFSGEMPPENVKIPHVLFKGSFPETSLTVHRVCLVIE